MKNWKDIFSELRGFLLLWSTQSLSALGSSMTSFALIIWSYQQQGSALMTGLLSVCSYAPYVLMSIFAGALSDRWDKRRTMMACDAFAALCSVAVLILIKTDRLQIGHLYVLNALNGLFNTVQQPASAVAVSMLVPEKHYQRVGGLQAFSNALVTVLTPVIGTAALTLLGLDAVLLFDLLTCACAMLALGFWIRLPEAVQRTEAHESVLTAAKMSLRYLRANRGILDLILYFAAINFVVSIFDVTLPAMLLSRANGGELALGLVNTFTGLATLAGSVFAAARPAPKSRVRVIHNALLISMSTENFLLAFGHTLPVWCFAAVLGWLPIPIMNANMDALFRLHIPIEMQGRVFAARNTLQFFTIPIGFLLGGFLIDAVFEPWMATMAQDDLLVRLLGIGKGSGAALMILILAFAGVLVCLAFRADRHIWDLDNRE